MLEVINISESLLKAANDVKTAILKTAPRPDSINWVDVMDNARFETIKKVNVVRGPLFGSFVNGPRLREYSSVRAGINQVNKELSKDIKITPRNSVLYYENSGMDWHTNNDSPGTRLYLIYNEILGSVFRYTESDTIIDFNEPQGWHLKSFEIPKEGQFWHAIKTGGIRMSFGFRIIGEN